MQIKEKLYILLTILFALVFMAWVRVYEHNTNEIGKLNSRVDEISEKVDMLVVPEKPTDYWEGKKFEINWYAKGDKNDKKQNTKHSNNISSNLFKRKTNNKSNTVDSYDISVDIITTYIKEKEGFHSKAYRDGCLIKSKDCPNDKKRYSNGYGTLAKSCDEAITEKEAEKRLMKHIEETIYPNLKGVKFKSEQQIYASIDFAYNIGHNTFRDKIVNENMEVDCARMTQYVVFNGKENEGLKKRRFENFIQCVSVNE